MPNTLPIRIFFLNSLVIFILMACQTPHPEKKILNLEKITQSSDSFGTSPILPTQISENYSYVLFDPDSNQVLDSHQPERMSIPASTSKIPSSIAALEILGPQYRFKTSLHLKGVLRHGVLQGDLFLKGTGDPMLKTPHLMSLAQALETKGIRKITGKFYYDESYFKSQVAIEEDREPWAPYNSGLSALSVNFNQINVRWMPDALRERHFIYSTPSFPFVQFQPLFRKTSRETQFLYRDELPLDNEAMEQWLLADAEVKGGHDRLPLKNPARATAHLFTTLCEMNGLTLPVPQKKSVPADAEWITAHESPPLVEIVEGLLEYSNNVTTELVQMAAARHLVRRAVNSPESAQVLGNWTLQNILLPGIRHSYSFQNGSGLTSQNRISPRQLVTILNFTSKRARPGRRSFESLLPISGFNGNFAEPFHRPGLAYRIRAKSGTMNFVQALAGWIYPTSGKKLIFAILSTNPEGRAQVDASPLPLANSLLDKSEAWRRQAREFEKNLLLSWILNASHPDGAASADTHAPFPLAD